MLREIGVDVVSHVIQLGAVRSKSVERPTLVDLAAVDESPVRCFDPAAETAMIDAIKAAAKEGDSLGGVAEVLAYGLPSASAATCTGTASSTVSCAGWRS